MVQVPYRSNVLQGITAAVGVVHVSCLRSIIILQGNLVLFFE